MPIPLPATFAFMDTLSLIDFGAVGQLDPSSSRP
jgi:hypothetical protein